MAALYTQRGKSGLQWTGWFITRTEGNLKESATESKPSASADKGETVR